MKANIVDKKKNKTMSSTLNFLMIVLSFWLNTLVRQICIWLFLLTQQNDAVDSSSRHNSECASDWQKLSP